MKRQTTLDPEQEPDEFERKVFAAMDEAIYQPFTRHYKKMKVAAGQQELTHTEQARCFANKNSDLQQAEACAKQAMFAYMQLRRLNSELLHPCLEAIDSQRFDCDADDSRRDACLSEALESFRRCLAGKTKVMDRYYNDHILQFAAINKMGANQHS